jgi:hypothetical protein
VEHAELLISAWCARGLAYYRENPARYQRQVKAAKRQRQQEAQE